jgi:hypothetical protein
VSIGDHQADPGKAAGDQAAQERGPARPILGGVQVKAQDLPGSGRVDPSRDHAGHVRDPPALAHLLGKGIEPHVGVGTTVQRTRPEGLDLMIELLGHRRDPRAGDPLDPQRSDQTLDPSGRHAAHVGLADHLDERALGPPAGLEQPVGEVAALTQLRDGQVDRAGPGVPGPHPVAVAAVRAFIRALTVRRAADRVRLLAHHPLTEQLHHLSQQVCVGLLDLLAHPRQTVHRGVDHRAPPPRVPTDLVEDDAVVLSFNDLQ